jgi:hypothetical protein
MPIAGTRRWSVATLIAVAVALGGCATMNQNECMAVDWRTIGYEDGVNGYSGDHIAQHRRACAKYGVTPDLNLYQAGRAQGLREYCRPQNGYEVGARGGSYNGSCPADMEDGFVDAYQSGRQLYMLTSRVANTANRIEAAHRELDQVEHEIIASSVVVVNDKSSSEDRAHGLVDTQQLAEKAGRLKTEIAELERNKLRYEQDLEDYRAAIPPSR